MKENIGIKWFGHSSFKMKINKATIFFDPIRKNNLLNTTLKPKDEKEVSAIFISHEHWDHFDIDTIKALTSKRTRIYCVQSAAISLSCKMTFDVDDFEDLQIKSGELTVIKTNDIIKLDDMKIKCLEATEGLSFLLEVKDEKILFMGDSLVTTEMVAEKPDVVIFPLWVVKSEETRLEDVSNLVKYGICIPMHYHTNRNALPNYFINAGEINKLFPKNVKVRILERNKEYNLKSLYWK